MSNLSRFTRNPAFEPFGSTAVSLALAIVLSLLVRQREMAGEVDPQLLPYVEQGVIHRLPAPTAVDTDGQAPMPASNGSVILHLRANVHGASASGEGQAATLVHGFELLATCSFHGREDENFIDSIRFHRVWETSYRATDAIPVIASYAEQSLAENKTLPVHRGQRRIQLGVIDRAVRAASIFAGIANDDTQAIWSVASLSGKHIRFETRPDGRIISLQPLNCGLSNPDVAWLSRTLLPKICHIAAHDVHAAGDMMRDAKTLTQVIPDDVKFTHCLDPNEVLRKSAADPAQSHRYSWQADPKFFATLYPRCVFAESRMAVRSSFANLACAIDVH
ncbi:MAG: hypothetical protein NXI32_09780 [bacterium]|nr:hypothetical protein [bacterium]